MILDAQGRSVSNASSPLSGLRADLSVLIRRAVRVLMISTLEDRVMHAEIVAAGPFRFRGAFVKDLGPHFGNNRAAADDLADITYRFFAGSWRHRYPDISPSMFLDKVEIVAPPTEAEIEDAWEVEIGSSESAMRQMYEGSARHRKGRDLGAKQVNPGKVD